MTQNTLYPKTKPKGRGVIPFGYAHNKDTNMLEAIPGYLEVLENTVNGLLNESIPSLREGLVYIKSELGQDVKISHQTLSNYLEKAGGKPTRQYTYHSEVKAKMSAKKAFNQNKKTVKALEKKLTKAKTQLKKKTTTLKKLDEPTDAVTNEGKIVDLEILPENVKAEVVKDNVIFAPNEGPQTEFLAAAETDVLYGGAAGGGKSYAMLVDPLRYAHRAAHRALIIRRSMPELRELIDKSRELYPKAFPGCKYREVEKLWNFPSGAKIEFGFLERDADVYRYQGQAYSWIGFDEITHLPTEFAWNYLASRLRTTDSEITPYMRCTANPGGVGAHWVKNRYIEPAEPDQSFVGKDGLTRKFIPARLEDNPFLATDGRYEQMLKALPPTQRKQLLEGNWDVNEGAAFTEFNVEEHVIPPFQIPIHWDRVKGVDYGYASESACIWAAIDPSDGTLIVYRELYQKGLTGEDLGRKITEMELQDPFSVQGVLDTAAWSRTGTTGPTVGETLVRQGHKLRRADKNRIQGKIQIHEYLRLQPSGRPRLQIFSSCPSLIRELQGIPLDKSNPEDVDTHAPDHAYDALRYLIMSRPRVNDPLAQLRHLRLEQAYTPADADFGY
jgi:DNA-binding protein YbaB